MNSSGDTFPKCVFVMLCLRWEISVRWEIKGVCVYFLIFADLFFFLLFPHVTCIFLFLHFLNWTNWLVFEFLMVCFFFSFSSDTGASAKCPQRGILHHRRGLLRTGRHLPQTGQTGAEQQPAQERGWHPACKHQNTFPSHTHFPTNWGKF